MRESYFVQWVNHEGLQQVPVLVTGCKSFEEAAAWAVTDDLPHWATDNTRFIVWHGRPGDQETPRAEYTVKAAR